MSIFGTQKKQMRGCGCRGVGLGADEIPWYCWDQSGFKSCSDQQFLAAQQMCDSPDMDQATKDQCAANAHPGLVMSNCVPNCSPPKTLDTTATTSGTACNSPATIMAVQTQIGTTADGKWGPLSAAALKKSGKTYQSFAPGCTGSIPGGGGYVSPPSGKTPSKYVPPSGGAATSTTEAGAFLGVPLIVWGGVAALAVVLLIAKKKKAATPNRRRRRHYR